MKNKQIALPNRRPLLNIKYCITQSMQQRKQVGEKCHVSLIKNVTLVECRDRPFKTNKQIQRSGLIQENFTRMKALFFH